MSFATTYRYEPLESDRHIRLLKIEGLRLERLLWKSKLMPRIPKDSKAPGFSILTLPLMKMSNTKRSLMPGETAPSR